MERYDTAWGNRYEIHVAYLDKYKRTYQRFEMKFFRKKDRCAVCNVVLIRKLILHIGHSTLLEPKMVEHIQMVWCSELALLHAT